MTLTINQSNVFVLISIDGKSSIGLFVTQGGGGCLSLFYSQVSSDQCMRMLGV